MDLFNIIYIKFMDSQEGPMQPERTVEITEACHQPVFHVPAQYFRILKTLVILSIPSCST
jgi:hypothetical protein